MMTPPAFACPSCGSTLQHVTDGLVGESYALGYTVRGEHEPLWRWKLAPFYACTGCEWCAEIPSVLDLRTQLEASLAVMS